MHPIAKHRVDDSVYIQLLDNIKRGVWKGGEKLPSESELCGIFQVSRVSIRSALQKLQALGFIEVKRAKGSFVCSTDELFDLSSFDDALDLDEKEFREIAALREMLEGASLRLLVNRREPVDLSRVADAHQGMLGAIGNLDLDSFTQHDHIFHLSIILAAGNDKFTRIAQIFRDDIYRFIKESNKFILRDSDDPEKMRWHFNESLVWHTELLVSLQKRDGKALDIQRRFLERNIERLMFYYQRRKNGK